MLQSAPNQLVAQLHLQLASNVPLTQGVPVQSLTEQLDPFHPTGHVHLQLSLSKTPPFWQTNGHVLVAQSIPV